MASWRAFGRRAFPRALVLAMIIDAAPVLACASMTVEELADRLPGTARFEAGAELLSPFLLLWRQRRGDALPAQPDGVAVFAASGQPLVLAYRTGDCLLGLLPAAPDDVWRALRDEIGPIA